MWMKFAHPNIAKFRGVNTELFQLALVYDWGENDTIIEYVKLHPNASRATLVPQLTYPPHDAIHLTPLLSFSCYKSRGVWSTFTPSAFHMGI